MTTPLTFTPEMQAQLERMIQQAFALGLMPKGAAPDVTPPVNYADWLALKREMQKSQPFGGLAGIPYARPTPLQSRPAVDRLDRSRRRRAR